MIYAPRMLLIGATGRNAGKTALATALIRRFSPTLPIIGAKVTAVDERNGQCPRGGNGCGVCSSLEAEYCITKEENTGSEKDTQRLLLAGAQSVYWLRVLKSHLAEGATALINRIGPDAWVVCESNSLRTVLMPGLFLMVSAEGAKSLKPSAAKVYGQVDFLATFDGNGFNFDLNNIGLTEDGWTFAQPSQRKNPKAL